MYHRSRTTLISLHRGASYDPWGRMTMGRAGSDDELLVRIPSGNSPSRGWPVLVFLHGCGERPTAFAALADLAASAAMVGVAPSGPLVTTFAGRSWAGDLASTHDCIESALARLGEEHHCAHDQVYLCGFSQGATHAYGLLAARPDRCFGAIVLSPGEGLELPAPPCSEPRPVYMSFGQREYRAFRHRARKWAGRWRHSGHPCLLEPHAGGHHVPRDWDLRFLQVVNWLRSYELPPAMEAIAKF